MKSTPEVKPLIAKRKLKHTFTGEEMNALYVDFRQAYATLHAVNGEFDAVKAQYKSKVAEAESRMETLNATLQAGFEMRDSECVVTFRPKDSKKDFRERRAFEELGEQATVLLTEDMTPDDFCQDLIQAESGFANRVQVQLWAADGNDGILVVGQLNGRWYSAVRGNIGAKRIEERLDSEQRSFKNRQDAVISACRRAWDWIGESFGDETAKGFEAAFKTAVESQSGRAE